MVLCKLPPMVSTNSLSGHIGDGHGTPYLHGFFVWTILWTVWDPCPLCPPERLTIARRLFREKSRLCEAGFQRVEAVLCKLNRLWEPP